MNLSSDRDYLGIRNHRHQATFPQTDWFIPAESQNGLFLAMKTRRNKRPKAMAKARVCAIVLFQKL